MSKLVLPAVVFLILVYGVVVIPNFLKVSAQVANTYVYLNGNVGIGTAAPGAKLNVIGRSYVTGDPYSTGDPSAADIVVGSGVGGGTRHNSSIMFWDTGAASRLLESGSNFYFSYWPQDGVTGANVMLGSQPNTSSWLKGNLGIGSTNPVRRLVLDTGGGDGMTLGQQSDNTETIQTYIDTHWTDRTTYAGGCCNSLLLQPDVGNVGIGTTTPGISQGLEISNNQGAQLRFRNVASNVYWDVGSDNSQGAFVIYKSGTTGPWTNGTSPWNWNSDQRLKTNIQTLTTQKGLTAIEALNPVSFDWIDTNSDKRTQLGFIAQEIQKIFPEVVSTNPKDITITLADGSNKTISKPLGVSYENLIPSLVKAIQEQQTQISTQQKEIDDLKTEVETLKNK